MRGREKSVNSRSGFTFVELLVATLVFSLALSGLLQSIFSTLYLSETSRDTGTALFHLTNFMERVRSVPFNSLASSFPPNTVDGPAANRYSAIVGGYSLRNEHIKVTYADPAADPRQINATLNWTDSRNRPYSLSLTTFKTR